MFFIVAPLFFSGCRTFDVRQDAKDGSKIIEYSFNSSDDGGADVLYSLELRFRKVIPKSGGEDLRVFFYAVSNAYMQLLIHPDILVAIDGKEKLLPIANLEYSAQRAGGADHKGYVETGIPYLHIRGELDLNSLRASLIRAEAVSLRIRREDKSAIINCSAAEIANIRKLIAHDGRD